MSTTIDSSPKTPYAEKSSSASGAAPVPNGKVKPEPRNAFGEVMRRASTPARGHAAPVHPMNIPGKVAAPVAMLSTLARTLHRPGVHEPKGHSSKSPREDRDLLSREERHLAQLAPPPAFFAVPETTVTQIAARGSLETLLPQLATNIAWSRTGQRSGTMRLVIGQGALAGATLLVGADEGKVNVHLSVPAHVDAAAWRARITDALAKRGLDIHAIEVESS